MSNLSSKKDTNPSERWDQLRNDFIDQVLVMFLIIAIVATPISISRSLNTGWLFLYNVQIILATTILLLYLFRKRISFLVKSTFFMIICWTLGMASLLTFGLGGGGYLWFMLFHFLIATIFSPRITTMTATITIISLALVGVGYTTGILKSAVDANSFMVRTSTWATVLVTFGLIMFMAFRSIGILQQSTRELFKEVQEQQIQINHMANHDQLTNLPVMRLARDRLEVAFRRAERNNKKVALLFIDLDGFKKVNDTYGHAAGDFVLQISAKRMCQVVRVNDTIARISGDEFLAILDDVTEKQAAAEVAKKIIIALSQTINRDDASLLVGASIGISLFPDDAGDVDTLKRLADAAMYKVKKAGKNNFTFVNDED